MLKYKKFITKAFTPMSKFPFSQTNPSENLIRLGPEYEKREFDAFKYDYEKGQSHLGYSSEELYGKKYGLKHSPAILKEMKKDNYMMVICFTVALVYFSISRECRYSENAAWNNYVHRDMDTVRPVPSHALKWSYKA